MWTARSRSTSDSSRRSSDSRTRSEEHTSELQSQSNLVCRLLLEKKKQNLYPNVSYIPYLSVHLDDLTISRSSVYASARRRPSLCSPDDIPHFLLPQHTPPLSISM